MRICLKCDKYGENDAAIYCKICGAKMVDEGCQYVQIRPPESKKTWIFRKVLFTVSFLLVSFIMFLIK
jgi:uncharacterized membrane protein YvbJ